MIGHISSTMTKRIATMMIVWESWSSLSRNEVRIILDRSLLMESRASKYKVMFEYLIRTKEYFDCINGILYYVK